MKWPVDTCPPQKVAQSTSRYYFVLQNPVLLRTTKLAQSTSQYYFPVLLRTTKLAQSTSQYYFVLQSLHKVLPSTTSYYKTCTKYVPVVLHTQSLHKVLPSTTSYYKACTKYVPVLLRTTKLAQSTSQYYFPVLLPSTTSQYYFVLQSLHKVRPSTTSYYKTALTMRLRTTQLAQSTSQYYFAPCNTLGSADNAIRSTIRSTTRRKYCALPRKMQKDISKMPLLPRQNEP